jgi:hypothetical protein
MTLLAWRLAAFSVGFTGATASAYHLVVRPIEEAHAAHLQLLATAERNVRGHVASTEARIVALEK